MQNDFNDFQARLFDTYAAIGRDVAEAAALNDAQRSFDHANWDRASAAGLWRLPVPRSLGGLGGSWTDCVAAIEGLASTSSDLGFLITTLGHVGSLRVMLEEGTDRQKARWLPLIMAGQVGVTAMTEASGGSDLARMAVAATPASSGWLLSGRKVHITNAPIASHGMIAGRIPSLGAKRDITLFFMDLDGDGISLGETEDNLGIRTSPTADLIFDAVALTADNIIGRPGDGLRVLHRIIAFERALYGVIASGLIEGMIDTVMLRTESRQAFGRPIADYQHVQRRITDMKIAAYQSRTATYDALAKLDSDAPDASIACSITKLMAAEGLAQAAGDMVRLHGHFGYMNNAISRQLRDAVGMGIAGGTTDIQRINIFNQMRSLRRAAQEPSSAMIAAQ